MKTDEVQQIFQLCSYLFSYPDQDFLESFKEIDAELELLSKNVMKDELLTFLQKAKSLTPSELISTYIQTFDFGKKTNLYVTYMTNGEQRERGMDLLFLKNYYKLHGFAVTDQELPDYLPIMLEFAGQTDLETFKPIFERYFDHIQEISDRLDPNDNLYAHIFQAILSALRNSGITKSVRRSEELKCSNSFYG